MGAIEKSQPAEAAVRIDEAIERGILATQLNGRMSRALGIAGAIQDIRTSLSAPGVMGQVMALQGSAIGFKTDKDQGGGYPESTVRDCLIEATLAGVYPVGNEFNIIAGRAYITKEGMGRKLRDIQGLCYSITPGIPEMKNGGAVVPMSIDWTHSGKADKRDLPVCVKVNNGMGADAIIGKATRKARAWLYQTVTGSEIPDGEAEAPMEVNVTPAKTSPFEAPNVGKTKNEKLPTYTQPEVKQLPFLDRLIEAAKQAGITQEQMNLWAGIYNAKTVEEISSNKLNMLSRMDMNGIIDSIKMTASGHAADLRLEVA